MEHEQQPTSKFPQPLSHSKNPHNNVFKVEKGQNSATITALQFDDWCSWIKEGEIPKGRITTFNIKQTQTNDGYIFTGIATDAIFGQTNAYSNKQSITFKSNTAKLWQNGVISQGARGVDDGELIRIVVDTTEWSLVWSVGSQQLANTKIPQIMRNKPLFLVIIMGSLNNMVELLYE